MKKYLFKNKNIFIIDDDEDFLEMTKEIILEKIDINIFIDNTSDDII